MVYLFNNCFVVLKSNKTKKKNKYHSVGTYSKSQIIHRSKTDTLTHIHMTVHFPEMVQALLFKEAGLN